MTAIELVVLRRKRRRTHLVMPSTYVHDTHRVVSMCGISLPALDGTVVPVPLIGGATTRLRNDIVREMDGNACIPCTRISAAMLALYVARDTGRPW